MQWRKYEEQTAHHVYECNKSMGDKAAITFEGNIIFIEVYSKQYLHTYKLNLENDSIWKCFFMFRCVTVSMLLSSLQSWQLFVLLHFHCHELTVQPKIIVYHIYSLFIAIIIHILILHDFNVP